MKSLTGENIKLYLKSLIGSNIPSTKYDLPHKGQMNQRKMKTINYKFPNNL